MPGYPLRPPGKGIGRGCERLGGASSGSHRHALPAAAAHVNPAEEEEREAVDVLGRPAESDVGTEMMDEHDAIDHVDGLHDHFEQEAHAGVARAGDGLEIDDAGDVDQIGRAEHTQRGDGSVLDFGDVGVDADDRLREQGDEQRGHEHERITQADVLEDGGRTASTLPAPMRLLTSEPHVAPKAATIM